MQVMSKQNLFSIDSANFLQKEKGKCKKITESVQ